MDDRIYKIIGRCLNGVRVEGYVVQDMVNGATTVLNKLETEDLVMRKLVKNCTGQLYNGKVILKGVNCKLVDLPNFTLDGKPIQKKDKTKERKVPSIRIVARIVKGKNTLGYVLYRTDSKGRIQEAKVERSKVIKMAREGKIANARAQRSNDTYVLRGVDCELAQLPVFKI